MKFLQQNNTTLLIDSIFYYLQQRMDYQTPQLNQNDDNSSQKIYQQSKQRLTKILGTFSSQILVQFQSMYERLTSVVKQSESINKNMMVDQNQMMLNMQKSLELINERMDKVVRQSQYGCVNGGSEGQKIMVNGNLMNGKCERKKGETQKEEGEMEEQIIVGSMRAKQKLAQVQKWARFSLRRDQTVNGVKNAPLKSQEKSQQNPNKSTKKDLTSGQITEIKEKKAQPLQPKKPQSLNNPSTFQSLLSQYMAKKSLPVQNETLPNSNLDQQIPIPILTSKESFLLHQPQSSSSVVTNQLPTLTKPILKHSISPQHTLRRVWMRPNYSKLQYVQYEDQYNPIFTTQNIQQLESYQLKGIGSVVLRDKQITDEVFLGFSRLDLTSLVSLQINDNQITDISSLKNLGIHRLKELDISWNPLNISSAKFLAQEEFSSLIFFTVSFQSGINEECWQVMLQNDLKNYPKLQTIEIAYQNQLNHQLKKRIVSCLQRKEQTQLQIKDKQGKYYYPKDYKIKIAWNQSKEVFDTYSQEKKLKICQEWSLSVNYEWDYYKRTDPTKKDKKKGEERKKFIQTKTKKIRK